MNRSTVRTLALLLILLLATGLRLYRLDAQSFWNDEGNAARAAERSIPLILDAAAGDIHPPGYYLLLHFWRALVGEREFSLRALSALCGILTVAFTYRLGRRLLGATTGLGAAFLLATSPLSIYYSQEARMYALLGLLATVSTYLLCRGGWDWGRDRLSLIGYVLAAAAGLYTHYAFPFILAVHNILFLAWWGIEGRRKEERWGLLLRWGGIQLASLLLFLPWLPVAIRSVTGWPSAGAEVGLGDALQDILRVLTVGITLELDQVRWVLLVVGLMLLIGLWPRRGRAAVPPALAVWLLLPIGLILALGLYTPAYLKFLLVVLPPFHLLLAHGVENLTQGVGAVLSRNPPARRLFRSGTRVAAYGVLIIAALLPSLRNLYFDPAYAREDYRQIAADIEGMARPGDGILLNAPNQWEVFTYYHREGAPVYPIPRGRPARADQVAAELEEIAAAHTRLFVLYWGDAEADPERLVESWLVTHAYPAGDRWYGGVRVAIYGLGPLPEEPSTPLDARFGEMIHLQGYTVAAGPFTPGEVIPVTLFWRVEEPPPERYKIFLHLLDEEGGLVTQTDTEPWGNLLPIPHWPPHQQLIDRHGVLIPAPLPEETYRLVMGLYHLTTGERLPVTVGDGEPADHLSLGSVVVTSGD